MVLFLIILKLLVYHHHLLASDLIQLHKMISVVD